MDIVLCPLGSAAIQTVDLVGDAPAQFRLLEPGTDRVVLVRESLFMAPDRMWIASLADAWVLAYDCSVVILGEEFNEFDLGAPVISLVHHPNGERILVVTELEVAEWSGRSLETRLEAKDVIVAWEPCSEGLSIRLFDDSRQLVPWSDSQLDEP